MSQITVTYTTGPITPSISASDVDLEYDATSGSIAYTINNEPDPAGTMTAAINGTPTIVNFTLGTIANNAVPFTCAANNASTDRTAIVTLTYTYGNRETVTKEMTVTQAAVPPMALYTYSINGEEGQPLEAPVGSTITLATGQDLNEDFTFAGWTTHPNDVTNLLNDSYTLIDDVTTFYAVYAHTTDGLTNVYQKVTSAPTDDDWSGDYLIAYSDEIFADGRIGGKDDNGSIGKASVSVDLSSYIANNQIPVENGDTYCVTLEEITSGEHTYVLKTKDGKYNYQSSNNNGLSVTSNKATAADYPISVTFVSADDIRLALGGEATGAVFRFNPGTTSQPATYFRFYKNCTQEPVYLYKKTTAASTTTAYYTRVFINETAAANMTIVGPSIIPSSSTLDMGSHSLGYAQGVSNLIIEDGGQLISHMGVQATMLKNITGTDFGSQANPTNAGYYLIASPLAVAPTAVNNMIVTTNGDYDLYAFDPTAEMEWQNYKNSNFTLALGKGYLYANSNTTTLEFAGLLNSGFVSTNLNYDANDALKSLNLVGNPFAHEYDFVVKNGSTAADFNYLTLNAAGNSFITNYTGGNAAVTLDPMEAILVQAPGTGYHFADPNVGDMPGIIDDGEIEGLLNISVSRNRGASVGSTAIIDNVLVSFGNAPLMKKIRLSDNATELCMLQGGEEMAVVRAQGQGELPVSFKAAENGSYTLSVEVNNVEMNYLHLIDNMTGADVDLLATPSYTFEAKTSDYASRFRLVFSANSISEDADGDNAFAYFNGSNWTINNMGEATLQVVDVMGRVLSSETLSGNAEVSINQPTGVYMLRLVSGDSVKVQKVVVR